MRELAKLVNAWDDVESNPERVSRIMERTTQKYPDFAPGWGHLGLAYMQSGRAKDAERALRQALSLEPEGAGWHLALSTLYKLAAANAKGLMEKAQHLKSLAEADAEVSRDFLIAPPQYVSQITITALECSYEYARQTAEEHAKEVLRFTKDKGFTHPAITNLLEIQTADQL